MHWTAGLLDQHFNSVCYDQSTGHCDHDTDQGNENVVPIRRVMIVLAETNFSGTLLHTEIQQIIGFPHLKRAT